MGFILGGIFVGLICFLAILRYALFALGCCLLSCFVFGCYSVVQVLCSYSGVYSGTWLCRMFTFCTCRLN